MRAICYKEWLGYSKECEAMILISYGTRPEWIKIKPLIKAFEGKMPFKLLFTGQHKHIIDETEHEVICLDIEDGTNRLDSIVSSIMNKDGVFEGVKAVIVQGDTTSAFSVALAAFHRKIKIIHLEAGLRTYDFENPYPEEANRQLIGRIADVHLCPTEINKDNLLGEKVKGKIYIVGNTVLDNLVELDTEYGDEIIITMHRRENHKIIPQWFSEIEKLAEAYPQYNFVLPIHPNPNVVKHKNLLSKVKVIEPLGYNDFIRRLAKSRMIITDSGGIQEEAAFLKKKAIVCRKETERIEVVGKFSFLCVKPSGLNSLFEDIDKNHIPSGECPYGDGHASSKILQILLKEEL